MRVLALRGFLIAFAILGTGGEAGFALSATQLSQLSGSDTNFTDTFGHSVSLYETAALIGAWGDYANENDTSTQQAGSAYIFEQNSAGSWVETAHLMATDPQGFDSFGTAAAIWGTTAVVSAIGETDTAPQSGAVYVFEKDAGGNWPLTARITDGATSDFRQFGRRLALHQNTLLVGTSTSLPVGVYQKNTSGQWTRTGEIAVPAGNGFGAGFGSLAIEGNRALLGSSTADHSGQTDPGAAFIFEQTAPGTWTQKAKLTANDSQSFDRFGVSVSLWGNTALVGVPFDEFGGQDFGSAYLFRNDGAGNWIQLDKLTPDDPSSDKRFGVSVSLFGNFALIGAISDDQSGNNSGAAYLFQEDLGIGWHQVAKFKAGDANADALFGNAVSLFDGLSLIGAENSSSFQFRAGAAYLFSVPEPSTVMLICCACGLLIPRHTRCRELMSIGRHKSVIRYLLPVNTTRSSFANGS
jgi:hypothetical protein